MTRIFCSCIYWRIIRLRRGFSEAASTFIISRIMGKATHLASMGSREVHNTQIGDEAAAAAAAALHEYARDGFNESPTIRCIILGTHSPYITRLNQLPISCICRLSLCMRLVNWKLMKFSPFFPFYSLDNL